MLSQEYPAPPCPIPGPGVLDCHAAQAVAAFIAGAGPLTCRAGTVRWYQATTVKNFTVRLPDEEAANAEALARAEGLSLNETVRRALVEAVEARRADPGFKARVQRIIQEDRQLLERLAK
jgi:hypothetical protein